MSVAAPPKLDVLLETVNLKKWFPVRAGVFRRQVGNVRAVDGVSLRIRARETLGLVGESGCGKSTLVQTLLRLLEPTEGQILTYFGGEKADITRASRAAMKPQRRHMQMVFQNPSSSMNPSMTIGDIVAEPLAIQGMLKRAEREKRVGELLESVGLQASHARRYPHAFSGGQRQRIGIARALALRPRLLILDEPVSALDVSVQSQVLNLLKQLKEEYDLTYLFIAHNLDVVRYMSDRISVMYLGRIVEEGTREQVYHSPGHPYTEALLASIPIASPDKRDRQRRKGPPAEPPDPAAERPGCSFANRCPYATDRCKAEEPPLRAVGKGQMSACHYAEELSLAGREG